MRPAKGHLGVLCIQVTDTDNNSSEACVQESSSTQPVHTAASSKGSTAKTAHTAAGSSTPTEPTESKRPVIMFHSSDDWVDTHTHTSNGSHTAAAAQQTKQEPLPGQPASQSVQNGLAKLGSMSQPATSERTHSAQPDSQSLSTVNGASSSGSTQAALGMTGQPRTAAVDAHSASFTREARAAGFALWDRLLRLALDDPQMASENWRMGGTLHRRKVQTGTHTHTHTHTGSQAVATCPYLDACVHVLVCVCAGATMAGPRCAEPICRGRRSAPHTAAALRTPSPE